MPRQLRQLRREDYTVGWVCALPVELAAAQEMLDEEHPDLERDLGDNDENLYVLGSIGGHNIVIACLPAGQIGNNPAANVATQMKATFKKIRFGLMVGIGGGVPSADVDIRLGDVVVSQPHQTIAGVIQYDLGKATLSGFERTGSLNSPPQILLSAVAKVRANELRGRSKLSERISKLDYIPQFRRNKAGPDILFEATYDHEGGQMCALCNSDMQKARRPRESEGVAVHYGTIASGNQVIRDGRTRDSVSEKLGGILCFEMEAAGLMNSFPCLVIRGICDYADSHKNKKWQPYAAGTAAAYAREILSLIPADQVAETETAVQTVGQMTGKSERKFTGEEKWETIMESRYKDGRCFNCGSEKHWEDDCLNKCGKCLYSGHKASKCRFPVRCVKCRRQGHIAGDCSDYYKTSKELYRGLSTGGSTNHNQEEDVLSSSDDFEPIDLETEIEGLAGDKHVHLNEQASIVDFLKSLGLAFDLNARERLAEKLHIRVGPTGSASQNIALHKALTKELVLNNGRVPSKIRECDACEEFGHSAVDCPNKCYACGEHGHWVAQCPNKSYNWDKFGYWATSIRAPTEDVVKAVAGNIENGAEVMALLLEHRGNEIKITEEVVRAAAGNSKSGKKLMELFFELRGDEVNITEEVVEVATGNEESGEGVILLLLDRKGDAIRITEEVVKAAVGNEKSGKEIVRLLLGHEGSEFQVTEGLVKAATGNSRNGEEVMALLLERRGNDVQTTSVSEFSDPVSTSTRPIFSVQSILSTAFTGNSRIIDAGIKRATDELASIFLQDQDLETLFEMAREDKRIGPERLARNFKRLFKNFSADLKEEAGESGEFALAKAVSSKAGFVATRILQLLSLQVEIRDGTEEDSAEVLRANNAKEGSIKEKENVSGRVGPEELSSKEDMDTNSDDEKPEDTNNTQFAQLVAQGQKFIEESNAFKKLREDFRNFVIPSSEHIVLPEPSISHEARSEVTPNHEFGPFSRLSQNIYMKMLAFSSSIGLGEKGIPPGHQRIWWMNRRGRRLYDDYIEHEPGALHALQEFLNASAYRTRMTPEGDQDRTSSPFSFPYTSNSNSAWVRSSDLSYLANQIPGATARNNRSNCGRKDAELGEMSSRTLHLLSCMEKGRHSIKLHQEIITHITDDRQLFHTLRRSYHEHRGRFRPYWSLRTVHSIHFMKFAYGGRRYIDVRCHDDICEHGKPCDCIPPADLVPPKGAEYECYPIPSKLSPPIGQRLMMDFFTDPNGIEPDTTLVIEQLPKRTCGELRSQPLKLIEAWGIYYKEDWDWVKIWWVLAIGFFPPSLLFGILWGILKKDIQGAFGVASWWMAGATILIGIVGTCTWTL